MKRLVLLGILATVFSASYGQESCDELYTVAKKYLDPTESSRNLFISDGQVYRAFVDADQEAEFEATFYGGSVYRIATTAGTKDRYVVFEVKDVDGNILFSNAEFTNEPYWDFNVQSTIDVKIVLRMDVDKRDSGCITMLIGFKQ